MERSMNWGCLCCHGEKRSAVAIHALYIGYTCLFVDFRALPSRARNDKPSEFIARYSRRG